jgi:hypothetical protein
MGSELMKMDPAKVPAHISALFEPEKNAGLVTSGDTFPTISLKGRRFRLRIPDKDEAVLKEGIEVPVVILGYDPEVGCAKTYYDKDYDPADDSAEPPTCSSADGVYPDEWIAEPMCDKCSGCEHNAWGSGKNGRGKACADQKRLVVVAPRQLTDADKEEAVLFVLRVPPASLKSLSMYARELSKFRVPAFAVTTVLSFDDDPKIDYPKLDFNFGGFLDEDQTRISAELMEAEVPELVEKIRRSVIASQEQQEEPPDRVTEEVPLEGEGESEGETGSAGSETDAERKKREANEKRAATRAANKARKEAEAAAEQKEEETSAEEPEATGDSKLDDVLKAWA